MPGGSCVAYDKLMPDPFSAPESGMLFCGAFATWNDGFTGNGLWRIAPTCPDPQVNPTNTYQLACSTSGCTCQRTVEQETLKVELTASPTTILPNLSWNTPTAGLTVKVTNQNGQPKQGIEIQMSVAVEQGSGGHLHHADRPLGTLNNLGCGTAGNPLAPCASGSTVSDGTTGFTYAAPELSGTYQFTATCVSQQCAGQKDMKSIDVKLANLTQIPVSPGNCYTHTDARGVIGAIAGQHTDNHWVRKDVPQRLEEFACNYQKIVINNSQVTDKRLFLNDASLIWGGLFKPHSSHRYGWSIDMRAESSENNTGEVPYLVAKKLIKFRNTPSGKVNAQVHCFKAGKIQIARSGNSLNKCDNIPAGRHLHVDFK